MNIKHNNAPFSRARGITLVEILLVISLLVILLSFAIPSMGGAAAKAEMTATMENVEHALHSARNMARMNEVEVRVNFDAQAGQESRKISFDSKVHTGILNYELPKDVVLVSDQDSFIFNQQGLVENPGQVLLLSKADDSITETMEIR